MLDFKLTWADVPFVPDVAHHIPPSSVLKDDKAQQYFHRQQPLADLVDELNRLLPWQYLQDFAIPTAYPGRNLSAVASPNPVQLWPNAQIKINNWYYPPSASRWSVFRGLATSSQVKEMLKQCTDTTSAAAAGGAGTTVTTAARPRDFVMRCNPIAPLHSDNDFASYTITTKMHLLPPRPLAEHGNDFDGLYLVTLVDERYYFQNTPISLQIDWYTTWTDVLRQLSTTLGIQLDLDVTVPAIYSQPEPDSQLWTKQENAAALLDAVAFNLGRVLVRKFDGTYQLQASATARTIVSDNRGKASEVVRLAGGDIFYSGTHLKAGSLVTSRNTVVPSVVNVTFPKYIAGDDPVPHFVNRRYQNQRPSAWYEENYGDVFTEAVPIQSGGLLVSGLQGVLSGTVVSGLVGLSGTLTSAVSGAGFANITIHDTAKALVNTEVLSSGIYLHAGVLNQTNLRDLAVQIATDYYAWQVGSALDEIYPGTFAWEPEGYHDIVWTYSERSHIAGTRVMRTMWNESIREMQHAGLPANQNTQTVIPKGVGGSSVALTVRDKVTDAGTATLATILNSGDVIAQLNTASIVNLPTANRWRGTVEDEKIFFEANSGASAGGITPIGIVYRHIDNTVPASHIAGKGVTQIVPNTTYGTNLVTFGTGFKAYPQAWTSGGISETVINFPIGGGGGGGGGGGIGDPNSIVYTNSGGDLTTNSNFLSYNQVTQAVAITASGTASTALALTQRGTGTGISITGPDTGSSVALSIAQFSTAISITHNSSSSAIIVNQSGAAGNVFVITGSATSTSSTLVINNQVLQIGLEINIAAGGTLPGIQVTQPSGAATAISVIQNAGCTGTGITITQTGSTGGGIAITGGSGTTPDISITPGTSQIGLLIGIPTGGTEPGISLTQANTSTDPAILITQTLITGPGIQLAGGTGTDPLIVMTPGINQPGIQLTNPVSGTQPSIQLHQGTGTTGSPLVVTKINDTTVNIFILRPTGCIFLNPFAPTTPTILIRQPATPTQNAFEIQDSSSNTILRMDENGFLGITDTGTPADGDVSTNECMFSYDGTTSDPNLEIKSKDSAGTVQATHYPLKEPAVGDVLCGEGPGWSAHPTASGVNGNVFIHDSAMPFGVRWGQITSGMIGSGSIVAGVLASGALGGLNATVLNFYSGVAVDSGSVVIFNLVNSGGFIGSTSIWNTDNSGVSINPTIRVTDSFGESGSFTFVSVAPLGKYSFAFVPDTGGGFGPAVAPFTRASLEVIAVSSGLVNFQARVNYV